MGTESEYEDPSHVQMYENKYGEPSPEYEDIDYWLFKNRKILHPSILKERRCSEFVPNVEEDEFAPSCHTPSPKSSGKSWGDISQIPMPRSPYAQNGSWGYASCLDALTPTTADETCTEKRVSR